MLQTTSVFTNVSKASLAKHEDLLDVFGTADEEQVCRIILAEGDIQARAACLHHTPPCRWSARSAWLHASPHLVHQLRFEYRCTHASHQAGLPERAALHVMLRSEGPALEEGSMQCAPLWHKPCMVHEGSS